MALFNKNPNEAAYVGGKKHWTDVIKNSGSGELLIWRQPEEDFNTNSTLVVMPGEEAIFIKGGTVEQVFENGTYKLSTDNYPFISRLRNAFSGGISTFNCVVYFVRKADSKEIRWGTETPIQVRDKVWGVRTDARVRGAYKVRIENPAKFLEKLIGNNIPFQFQEELDKYFASEFQGKIKTAVSKFLNALEQELIGIDAYMDELSEKIEPYIDEIVSDYGLYSVSATYFFIEFVVGLIFVFVKSESYKASLVVQIIIAGVYAIMLIANMIANENTADSTERHEDEVAYIKRVSSRVKMLVGKSTDRNANKEMERVYDLLHSSPSKSSMTVKNEEAEIVDKIANLEGAVASNSASDIIAISNEIISLVEERNRKLRI